MTERPTWAELSSRQRSAVVAAAALLAALLVGLIANAVAGGDGGSEAREDPLAPLVRAEAPQLEGVFNDPEVGAVIGRPQGWSADRKEDAVRLQSSDESVVIAISSPAKADETEGVLDSALVAIESQYRDVEVGGRPDRTIAGRPTESAVVSATSSRGTPLRVLISAVEGAKEAYLVEVFAARDVSDRRLAEAQAALGSLRLLK